MDKLVFDNQFTQQLPADKETKNYPRQVTGACFSWVLPQQVKSASLVAYSTHAAELLDLTEQECQTTDFSEVFSGNKQLTGMQPYATCYGGHQFGNWAGQLGDGRAINLGEVINQQGQRWALQLKGAGPTPYSRTADGLAVLRSSIREFLCSEAMYHLGVPTTRALSLVTTGEEVVRDVLYDGHPAPEKGAVVCRIAPSFTRFGHIQYYAQQNVALLKQFVDYTIRIDFSHLAEKNAVLDKTTYLKLFEEVSQLTCTMVVEWMRVGFVHGVMNTDNMSILGLTIDYGPYGWLEPFDLGWTPNTTDAQYHRYAFGEQAKMAHWNLYQLANALYPLVEEAEPLERLLNEFSQQYHAQWLTMMCQKLGFSDLQEAHDTQLIDELLNVFAQQEIDMTIFFRQLAKLASVDAELDIEEALKVLTPAFYSDQISIELRSWLVTYWQRRQQDSLSESQRQIQMNQVNPKYVLRNYLAQLAIDKSEQGDHSLVVELLEVLAKPYEEQPDKEHLSLKRPDWAKRKVGCSMLSCSS